MPETNSGSTVDDKPKMVMMRSMGLPTWSAAQTPPKMLKGTTSTKATIASFSEFLIASTTKPVTGWRRV